MASSMNSKNSAKNFALYFTSLLFGLAAPPVCAGVPPAAQSAISAAYSQINTAFTQHDLTRFMSYFTPDYTVVDEKGATYNKEQTRKQYDDQLRQVRTMQSRFTVQNFVSVPGGVQAEMKLHTQGIGEKKVLFMKFKGTYADDLWVRDFWVQTPQGWRVKSRKTLSDKLVTHPG